MVQRPRSRVLVVVRSRLALVGHSIAPRSRNWSRLKRAFRPECRSPAERQERLVEIREALVTAMSCAALVHHDPDPLDRIQVRG
jgi:hypothetical protein